MTESTNKSALFSQINTLIQAQVKRISDLKKLALLETQLAGKSFVSIFMLTILLLFISFSTWITLLLGIFFYLVSLSFSYLSATACLLAINLLGCAFLYFAINAKKSDLTFHATRRQFKDLLTLNEETANERA